MIRSSVLTLISETQPHGVFDDPGEMSRVVFCSIRSVGMREAYEARSIGIHPEIVFVLQNYAEYGGEKLCEFEGVRYRIIRSYVTAERIELTAERVVS